MIGSNLTKSKNKHLELDQLVIVVSKYLCKCKFAVGIDLTNIIFKRKKKVKIMVVTQMV